LYLEQELADVRVLLKVSVIPRGLPRAIFLLRVCALPDEKFDDVTVSQVTGDMEACLLLFVQRFDICLFFYQEFHDFKITVFAGQVQERRVRLVSNNNGNGNVINVNIINVEERIFNSYCVVLFDSKHQLMQRVKYFLLVFGYALKLEFFRFLHAC